jgi:hypothetical protein
MASSLPEAGLWSQLPEELILKLLDGLEWTRRDSGAVRGTCRRWRATHDAARKMLRVRDGVPQEVLGSLCGRLRALTALDLWWVDETLTGLRAVSSLKALTRLHLDHCPNLTDTGLQELSALPALTELYLHGCCTSKAGRGTLQAAIPGLTIYF